MRLGQRQTRCAQLTESARRYSVGNMCNHPSCKAIAESIGLKQTLEQSLATITADEVEHKYVVRILQKLR